MSVGPCHLVVRAQTRTCDAAGIPHEICNAILYAIMIGISVGRTAHAVGHSPVGVIGQMERRIPCLRHVLVAERVGMQPV